MPRYYCRLERREVPVALLQKHLIESFFDSDLIQSQIKSDKITEDDVKKRDILETLDEKREITLYNAINVEVACGLGDFLLSIAAQRPDELFIGIDYALPVIQRAIIKLDEQKLENVLFFYGRVEDFFMQFYPAAFIDLIMVNYPDPWPKDRHIKRRIIQEKNIRLCLPFLKPNAKLVGVTDLEDLHAYHMEQLSSINELENVYFDILEKPHPFYEASSSFEKRALKDGRQPNYFAFRKKS